MRHEPHNAKRALFWILLAATFLLGLILLFVLRSHRIQGELALGFVALLVLKHVGLLMIVGAPLTAALKTANRRTKELLRKFLCGDS
jgi:hypothetical protein